MQSKTWDMATTGLLAGTGLIVMMTLSLWAGVILVLASVLTGWQYRQRQPIYRLAQLPERNPMPVLIIGQNGALLYGNPAARKLAKALCDSSDIVTLLPASYRNQLTDQQTKAVMIEQRQQSWLRFAFISKGEGQWYCYIEDVTESERQRQKVHQLAYFDPITGLGNRVLLNEKIDYQGQQGISQTLAIVAIEGLDEAASIQGLTMTEHYLTYFAEQLVKSISQVTPAHRPCCVRFNGYEFAALFPVALTDDQQHELRQRLLALVDPPQTIGQRDYWLTHYIGLAVASPSQAEQLVRQAHIALYTAKAQASHYQAYDRQLEALISERAKLEQALSQAIQHGQLSLHYQPQIHADHHQLRGFEALMRWQFDDQMIPPSVFIPIAERNGLIRSLGTWAIEQACQQLALWQQESNHNCFIAVNVSPQQFIDRNFAHQVARIMAAYQVQPALLQLEITESLLMEDEQASLEIMAELKALGVSLAIDDFGTGYSSFHYLARFPVDKLKIDRAFVIALNQGAKQEAVVGAMIDVGEQLGLTVVAEGVEHAHELETLKRLGCHLIQGYYYSRPVPADQTNLIRLEY